LLAQLGPALPASNASRPSGCRRSRRPCSAGSWSGPHLPIRAAEDILTLDVGHDPVHPHGAAAASVGVFPCRRSVTDGNVAPAREIAGRQDLVVIRGVGHDSNHALLQIARAASGPSTLPGSRKHRQQDGCQYSYDSYNNEEFNQSKTTMVLHQRILSESRRALPHQDSARAPSRHSVRRVFDVRPGGVLLLEGAYSYNVVTCMENANKHEHKDREGARNDTMKSQVGCSPRGRVPPPLC